MNHKLVFLVLVVLVLINIVSFLSLNRKSGELKSVQTALIDAESLLLSKTEMIKEMQSHQKTLHVELEEQEKKVVEAETQHRSDTLHLDDTLVAQKREILGLKNKILKLQTRKSKPSIENGSKISIVASEYKIPFHYHKPITTVARRIEWNSICLSDDILVQEKQTRDLLKKCSYVKSDPTIFKNTNGFTHTSNDAFKIFLEFAWCQIPFSFIRYGDGEYFLSIGYKVGKKGQNYDRDKWYWDGGKGKLGQDLDKAMRTRGNFFIGVPCPGIGTAFDSTLGHAIKSMDPEQSVVYRSQSLLFWGQNFKSFVHFMHDVVEGKLAQSVILILNHSFKIHHDSLLKWAHSVYYLPDDGPNLYEKHREEFLDQIRNIAKSHQNVLFIFAGGPLAKPLISEMWKVSKCNQYVDAGSALHWFILNKTKREDAKENDFSCPIFKYFPSNQTILVKPEPKNK